MYRPVAQSVSGRKQKSIRTLNSVCVCVCVCVCVRGGGGGG